MAVTKVTTQSWGSRLAGAFKGIIIGIIMFIIGIPLLWINEGRAVKTYKSLKEGAGAVIEVASDHVDSANEGKLIHISGTAATEDVLTDSTFGVSINAIKLERHVEMYQWVEHSESKKEKKLGGSEVTTTTYTYSKEWSSTLNSSQSFQEEGHDNPTRMPYSAEKYVARNVTVGAFKLNDGLISSISGSKDYKFTSNTDRLTIRNMSINEQGIYISIDGFSSETNPKIGDVKVTFTYVEPHDVSVIAQQSGNSFMPYMTKVGKTISMLYDGVHPAAEMFESAQRANKVLTWILRLVGIILMYAGVSTILNPIVVLADVVPFFGKIAGIGTSLISALVSIPVALLTIAVAWIFYRPILAIFLILVVLILLIALIGLIILACLKGKKKAE